MDLFVINLVRRPDRLERVTSRFESLGLSPTPFRAVDANLLERGDDPGLVTPGLRANWLSHEALLADIADSAEEYALVLEDDAVPDTCVNWPRFLADADIALARMGIDFLQIGFVGWQYRWTRPGLIEQARVALHPADVCHLQIDGRRRIIVGSVLSGAHAYIVRRTFAQRIAGVNDPCWTSSDGLFMRLASMSGADGRFPVMGRLARSIVEQESRGARTSKLDSDVM